MKNVICFIFSLVISNNVFAGDSDRIVQNIKSVCLSPSESGKYWDVSVTGKVNGEATVRLINIGVNGEANFSKGEWDSVQHVLKEQRAGDNANYRDCVTKITPLFLKKFTRTVQKTTPANTNRNTSGKSELSGNHQSTVGSQSPNIISEHDVILNRGLLII